MSEALTTQYLWKRWANQVLPSGTNTGDDPVLHAMIDMVSDAVASRLDRKFAAAEICEWLNGSGTRVMQVRHWPIQQVFACGVSSQDAIQIKNTAAQFASVATSETGISFQSITAGASANNSLTYATYPTLTLLVAAINNLSGWNATVLQGMVNYYAIGDQPSILLRPGMTGYCVAPDDFTIEIADQIEECRVCARTERSIERRYGSPFPMGLENIFLWYKAGYDLPVDAADHASLATVGNLPSDLTHAVNIVVKAVIDGSDDLLGGAQGGTVGTGYTYQLAPGGRSALSIAMDEVMPLLQRYRRLAVGF